jgi:N-acetyl-anhydromuramyl-L-alanine amidase AmpD
MLAKPEIIERVKTLYAVWKDEIKAYRNWLKEHDTEEFEQEANGKMFEIEDIERQLWSLGYGINEADELHSLL